MCDEYIIVMPGTIITEVDGHWTIPKHPHLYVIYFDEKYLTKVQKEANHQHYSVIILQKVSANLYKCFLSIFSPGSLLGQCIAFD